MGCSLQKEEEWMLGGQKDLMSYTPMSHCRQICTQVCPPPSPCCWRPPRGPPHPPSHPGTLAPPLPHEFILVGSFQNMHLGSLGVFKICIRKTVLKARRAGDRSSVAVAIGTPCPHFNHTAILVSVCIFASLLHFYLKQTAPHIFKT